MLKYYWCVDECNRFPGHMHVYFAYDECTQGSGGGEVKVNEIMCVGIALREDNSCHDWDRRDSQLHLWIGGTTTRSIIGETQVESRPSIP